MNDIISNTQWNQLTDIQKTIFKEEIGKDKYPKDYLPNYDEIFRFLDNNDIEIKGGMKQLTALETPPQIQVHEINELWEMVLKFFNIK